MTILKSNVTNDRVTMLQAINATVSIKPCEEVEYDMLDVFIDDRHYVVTSVMVINESVKEPSMEMAYLTGIAQSERNMKVATATSEVFNTDQHIKLILWTIVITTAVLGLLDYGYYLRGP
jgi:hypothetical protein